MKCTCTIHFEDPFWVGIFEKQDIDGYSAARFVFGKQPSDAELYQFALKDYARLEFSRPIDIDIAPSQRVNFKRAQRQARRMLEDLTCTKAQAALQAGYEANKKERQRVTRAEREAKEEFKLKLRLKRKKEKHKGH